MRTADIILQQMGGHRFVAMTGCSHFVSDGDTLRMSIPKNGSRANRLYITLDTDDTYTMRFFRYTAPKLSRKTFEFVGEKVEEVKTYTGVYFDQLQELFTEVTKMYTRL